MSWFLSSLYSAPSLTELFRWGKWHAFFPAVQSWKPGMQPGFLPFSRLSLPPRVPPLPSCPRLQQTLPLSLAWLWWGRPVAFPTPSPLLGSPWGQPTESTVDSAPLCWAQASLLGSHLPPPSLSDLGPRCSRLHPLVFKDVESWKRPECGVWSCLLLTSEWTLVHFKHILWKEGFPGGSEVRNLPANAGNMGSIPGPGRSHVPWDSWACAPQLLGLCSRAWEPQLRKRTCTLEPRSATGAATAGRSLHPATRERPLLSQREKSPPSNKDPASQK